MVALPRASDSEREVEREVGPLPRASSGAGRGSKAAMAGEREVLPLPGEWGCGLQQQGRHAA